MKTLKKYLCSTVTAVLILTGVLSYQAQAQLDPGARYYLYENNIRIGEVYVLERSQGQTEYVEDWVLYPGYLYPGPSFMGALEIVPSRTEKPYASEADFFQRVPFEKGSRFIRVTAQESPTLPVAR